MQELTLSVHQRINKTKQVIEQVINSQRIRFLRQEQKIRCEKQSFILSMMRSNKIMSANLKKSYYKNSFQLMKLIQPTFQFKLTAMNEDDFLNDFVHLYTAFFNYFETKFSFKTKIKNFLRPTNHNLIVDLVKYFVDFTRDYYVQTLFWKIKNYTKSQNIPFNEEDLPSFQQSIQDSVSLKVKPLGFICRNFSQGVEPTEISLISPRKRTADDIEQKKTNQKIYDILQVTLPSLTITSPKQSLSINLESYKIKVNQLFRDQKSRNSNNKQIYQDYCDFYNQKQKKKQNNEFPIPYFQSYKKSDSINIKCLPIKMLLNIQKNGFSVIVLELDTKRIKNNYLTANFKFQSSSNVSSGSNNSSPLKNSQNSLSPLKINQRVSQGDQNSRIDYFLTSMKVLRISQNFLPPLIASNAMINSLSNSKNEIGQNEKRLVLPFSIKLKKMTDEIEEAIPFMNQVSNSSNVLVRSTSYKKQFLQKDKKRRQKFANQIYQGDYINSNESVDKRAKRSDSQDSEYRISNKKLSIKKKIFNEGRKSYQAGTYLPTTHIKHNTQANQQSEEKILQWLQKIKNLKQIQRKKILGMNF